jgi:hypothetical protein
MNCKIAVFAAALAAFAFIGPSAHAGSDNLVDALNPFSGPTQISGTVAGASTTAAYFAINHWKWDWDAPAAGISQAGAMTLTTIGCAAIAPMIATVLVDRPLTYREAGKLTVGCFIPFIGPLIVDALYDAHPEWEKVHPAKVHYVKKHRRRRH